jgi:quinol---cytochrome c reductase iron-sulfur subunit, bacillus type
MKRFFRKKPTQLMLPGVDVRRQRVTTGLPRGPIERARIHLVTAPVTRRRFLAGTLGWVSATIGAALGVPAAAAVVSPMLRHEDLGWSPVGSLSKPRPGESDLRLENQPILTQFTSLVEDAYLKAAPRDVAIYVVNQGGGRFTIFDDHCTHLGCPYNWNANDKRFECPCHNGAFDAEGRVLGGPPPRPLDRYEYRVENGVLFVGKLYRVDSDLRRVT